MVSSQREDSKKSAASKEHHSQKPTQLYLESRISYTGIFFYCQQFLPLKKSLHVIWISLSGRQSGPLVQIQVFSLLAVVS